MFGLICRPHRCDPCMINGSCYASATCSADHPPSACGTCFCNSFRRVARILRSESSEPTFLANRSHSSTLTLRITCLIAGICDGTNERCRRPSPINNIVYTGSPAISPQRLVSTFPRLAARITDLTSLMTAGFAAVYKLATFSLPRSTATVY